MPPRQKSLEKRSIVFRSVPSAMQYVRSRNDAVLLEVSPKMTKALMRTTTTQRSRIARSPISTQKILTLTTKKCLDALGLKV